MAGMAAGMVGAQVAGGVIGHYQGKKDRAAASAAMAAAMDEINRVGAPPDLSKEIILSKFQQAGLYTPQLENVINQSMSQAATKYRQAQEGALQNMQQVSQTGYGAIDQAALARIQDQTASEARGRDLALQQEMQMRGQGGGGAALAMRLGGMQNANRQASSNALQVAADSALRRMNAIGQVGQMGSQMEQQQSAIDMANAQNQRGVQQRNIGMQNDAQQANLAGKQSALNANTQMGNQELYRQSQAKEQMWQNKLALASAKASALTGQANYLGSQAQNKAQMWSGIGNAVSGGIGAYGQNQANSQARAEDRDFQREMNYQNNTGGKVRYAGGNDGSGSGVRS